MPVPHLKQRYIASYAIAIGLILAVSLTAHFLTMSVISEERGAAEVVNLSGKQRMLSQRVLALVEIGGGDRQRDEHASLLRSTVGEIERANLRLQTHASEVRDPALRDELTALYLAPDTGIAALLDEYLAIATGSLSEDPSVASLQRMEALALGDLITRLDQAVALFEANAEMGLSRISQIQLIQIVAIVSILAAEAFFIFWPLLKKTMEAVLAEREMRQVAEDALRFQTASLASKSRFLVEMKATFFKPLAQAQDKLDLAAEADPELAPELIRDAREAIQFAAKRAMNLTRNYETLSESQPLAEPESQQSRRSQAS